MASNVWLSLKRNASDMLSLSDCHLCASSIWRRRGKCSSLNFSDWSMTVLADMLSLSVSLINCSLLSSETCLLAIHSDCLFSEKVTLLFLSASLSLLLSLCHLSLEKCAVLSLYTFLNDDIYTLCSPYMPVSTWYMYNMYMSLSLSLYIWSYIYITLYMLRLIAIVCWSDVCLSLCLYDREVYALYNSLCYALFCLFYILYFSPYINDLLMYVCYML